jgi:predicted nucleic acid-binding protein
LTRAVVCDASAIVALLLDDGRAGQWAAEQLQGRQLLAPDLMPFEAANIVRRQELAGTTSADQAAQAHADLLDLAVELWPYELLSGVCWARRQNLSIYDAAYVAIAEVTDSALVTLDARIAEAPDLLCRILLP